MLDEKVALLEAMTGLGNTRTVYRLTVDTNSLIETVCCFIVQLKPGFDATPANVAF